MDYMNVSIASRADGIILQYSGEDGLEDKIDEAVADGIRVRYTRRSAMLPRQKQEPDSR